MIACVLYLALPSGSGHAQTTMDVPEAKFQGTWHVQKHFFRTLREGEADFEALGEETPKGKFPSELVIQFRRHESGAIQQIWTDPTGDVIRSKGVTVLEVTPNVLTYRAWSDHPTWKNILTLKDDGSAVFQVRSMKHQETYLLAPTNKADGFKQPSGEK
ncbi:hypothetical protein [Prosthecobacter dejongeii]|nr:hypothetical protein [Prosthecobacter dejongeii]